MDRTIEVRIDSLEYDNAEIVYTASEHKITRKVVRVKDGVEIVLEEERPWSSGEEYPGLGHQEDNNEKEKR